MSEAAADVSRPASRALEVFLVFLRLGLTSFGGPIAHLGYFRQALVVRRGWLDETAYADLVALCQFLPGPASSQVGFAIGLMRAGPLGAAAAWLGFTLPSAILMTVMALSATNLGGPAGQGLIHGLKLVAVAVVAQAVFGMARSFTPDLRRAAIALIALILVTLLDARVGQVVAIAAGAALGLTLVRKPVARIEPAAVIRVPRRLGLAALATFAALLIGLPILAGQADGGWLPGLEAFYRSGALVFGGGHVVLPLLQAAVVEPGWLAPDVFVAGYGAAQAMPGPLFTFAAYLGASMPAPFGGVTGAALALVAIFLPGLLVLLGVLPFWQSLRLRPAAQAAMAGTNAAVVGILAAALYNPLWIAGVADGLDVATAVAGLTLLTAFRAPPLVIVVLGALIGVGRGLVGF